MKIPYGDNKGWLLINLPGTYVFWFNKKGLPKGELRKLLELLYQIKLNGLKHLVHQLK
jgi:uncharacterized protein (DUF3820 family)